MIFPDHKDFITEIPNYHPASLEYVKFWQTQLRASIEGKWINGRYIMPSLHAYVNLLNIRKNEKGSKIKKFGRPNLRDLEWKIHHYYNACRGFSGFALDDTYSSNYVLLDELITDDILFERFPDTLDETGARKQFMHPITNLSRFSEIPLGRALYTNNMWNGLVMGSRDTGKSYIAAGLIAKEFLFDGAAEYNKDELPSPVDITVGAEDSQKSMLLLSKVKDMIDLLPGDTIVQNKYYPSPFAKQYSGSFVVGKHIIAEYEKKLDGGWKTFGSKSMIKHRSFKDNPFADQGARNLIIVLEEVGLFNLLKQVYHNTKDNLMHGDEKTGMLWMMGTGGDMEGGTLDSQDMFYTPEEYDIFYYDDIFEHSGKIAFFIPAFESLNNFKDPNFITKVEEARNYLMTLRVNLSKNPDALSKHIQYRPLVPSEMFLTKGASIFPQAEIQNRLTEIQNYKILETRQKKVNLYFDPESDTGVSYKIDNSLIAIDKFPWNNDTLEGATVIYEMPQYINNKIQKDSYVIGYDAFKANSNTGESLAAIYVVKTNKYFSQIGYSEIVASFVGRPYYGIDEVNEILYKLSLFYGNAKIFFENTAGNTKDYFERIKRLDLLALQPTYVLNKKASYNTAQSLVYGYPMSNDKVKWEAIKYLKSWLLEEREITETSIKRNLDFIPDRYILQQLKSFNMKGNFDGVMALVGCIIGLNELSFNTKSEVEITRLSQLESDIQKFITNNERLFKTKTKLQREDQRRLSLG